MTKQRHEQQLHDRTGPIAVVIAAKPREKHSSFSASSSRMHSFCWLLGLMAFSSAALSSATSIAGQRLRRKRTNQLNKQDIAEILHLTGENEEHGSRHRILPYSKGHYQDDYWNNIFKRNNNGYKSFGPRPEPSVKSKGGPGVPKGPTGGASKSAPSMPTPATQPSGPSVKSPGSPAKSPKGPVGGVPKSSPKSAPPPRPPPPRPPPYWPSKVRIFPAKKKMLCRFHFYI